MLALFKIASDWRLVFPRLGSTEAYCILALGIGYSVYYWLYQNPWNDWSNTPDIVWALVWSVLWPFINIVFFFVAYFLFTTMEENTEYG